MKREFKFSIHRIRRGSDLEDKEDFYTYCSREGLSSDEEDSYHQYEEYINRISNEEEE